MSVFSQLMMRKKIPSIYKVLDYIQSTGTQYIDTGIVPTSTTRVVTEIEVSTTEQDIVIFGCKNIYANLTNANHYHLTAYLNKWYFGKDNTQGNAGTYDNIVGTIYKIDFNNNQSIYINGTEIASSIGTVGNGNLIISARIGQNTKYGKFKYRSFIVYEGTSLVANFIPVYDTLTNKYGMWESVQGKFYGNDGTGDFKGSIVGYTVVGSPTITDGVVSGFTTSDYLSINTAGKISSADTWEICFKFGTSSSGYFLGSNVADVITYSPTTSGLYLSSNGSSWDIASNVGTGSALPSDCWLRIKFTGTQYIAEYSTDKISWIATSVVNSSVKIVNFANLYIGKWQSSFYRGSIDMNETYIKINNKLWFNGQQS